MSSGTHDGHGRVHAAMHHHGPASPQLATRLRRQLTEWARDEGLPADTTYDIGLACYEAMANTVTHAYPSGTIGPLELHARLDSGSVEVTVADRGRWQEGAVGSGGGHGLTLIRRLTAHSEVQRGEYGTTVRMSWPRKTA
ncbi:ATP-binding protein [Actinophytocola sp.]|uniref:ATP-binding protein n=1 Tax=Actinophytocola sp. TaxID=1872138 RepID=UPI003D6B65B5